MMSHISISWGVRGSTPDKVHQLFLFNGVDDMGAMMILKQRNKTCHQFVGIAGASRGLSVEADIGDCIDTVRYLARHKDHYV